MSGTLTNELKEYARDQGADLVGIGDIQRFDGAPRDWDPRYIMPEARALVALAFRIHRGDLRGVEEGTNFGGYGVMGYANVNNVHAPVVLRQVSSFIEDHGYESFNFANVIMGRASGGPALPVRPDFPEPDVKLHFRIAAFLCGLGEIGWSKIFLTPEFGPRQRLQFLITDAPLDPDPLYDGPALCNRCMRCVRKCPVGAIDAKTSVKVVVAGRELEWGRIDQHKCGLGWCTSSPERNPFLNDATREYYEQVMSDPRSFEERQPDVWAPKNRLQEIFPPTRQGWEFFQHPTPICGGRGCIRECMVSLEERGVTTNRFKQPFRRRPEWSMTEDVPVTLPFAEKKTDDR
jgi:epoxyqueuosine reductase